MFALCGSLLIYMLYMNAEKKLRLLACAECDLGPLGWNEEGGTEFWLACARVGYRQ
jgi:hypothetical protein